MANTTNFGWETPDDTDLVKDGAAAIRTLGSAIDTSLVDLKGGTTGQILSKTSNTDMDFTWIANDVGDITAVTAGTGISGGGTSGAVTITNSMATTIDAKGDLVVGTGADAFGRLAVGANDTVLMAASGETTGLKWGTVAGWNPNFQLLNSGGTALTGSATVTVSGISGKNALMVVIDGGSASLSATEFFLRLNGDTSTNYAYVFTGVSGTAAAASSNLADSQGIWLYTTGANADNNGFAVIHINGTNAAGYKPITFTGRGTGITNNRSNSGNGFYTGTSTISSVSLYVTQGTLDAGTMYVYGA